MARPLPSFYKHPSQFVFVPMSVFLVFSILTFLCVFHKTKKSQRKKEVMNITSSQQSRDAKVVLAKLNSKISSKASAVAKMISWRKVEAAEDQEEVDDDDDHHDHEMIDDSDESVWRKRIIMGERCSPLNFSGKIVYDSDGNLVPDSDSPASSK